MWVPPNGWDCFRENYAALQLIDVPQNLQRLKSALLTQGANFYRMQQAQQTIWDNDLQNWLLQTKKFADALKSTRPDVFSACLDQSFSSGVVSDAIKYWTGSDVSLLADVDAEGLVQQIPSPQEIADKTKELEDVLIFAAVGIAALFVVPPLIRALRE
jgi:hypothetical protein